MLLLRLLLCISACQGVCTGHFSSITRVYTLLWLLMRKRQLHSYITDSCTCCPACVAAKAVHGTVCLHILTPRLHPQLLLLLLFTDCTPAGVVLLCV